MKLAWRPLPIVLFSAVAMLALLAASPAHAIDCGDTSGPGDTNVPCSCGDTVTTDTDLDVFDDPVISGNCKPVGLYIAGGVRVNAHQLSQRLCADSYASTVGLWIIGNHVTIFRGVIRGCDVGILGETYGSTIQRVTTRDGAFGIALEGSGNALLYNLSRRNDVGIFVLGGGNQLQNNYCHENGEVGLVVAGDDNSLAKNECYYNEGYGVLVFGDANTLTRNLGKENGADGIHVEGSFNFLGDNQGRKNTGHGVFAVGGDNLTDGGNYGTENGLKPDCSIDGQSVPNSGGRRC